MANMSFEQWLTIVDHLLSNRLGFPNASLPDWCWWDLWDSELSPREAVQDYIDEEGFYC